MIQAQHILVYGYMMTKGIWICAVILVSYRIAQAYHDQFLWCYSMHAWTPTQQPVKLCLNSVT